MSGVKVEHTCHARGCDIPVPPRLCMCRRHWFMVPRDIRARVWATYRAGQEVDKQPSRGSIEAITDAINAVAEKERRPS